MYLDHTKSKLGSTNAKIHTGGSELVTRLKRKTGGAVKRTKHASGGMSCGSKYSMGGRMTPSPAASKFSGVAHKKGHRIKREHHFLGALLGGAASAIPGIIDLVSRFAKR